MRKSLILIVSIILILLLSNLINFRPTIQTVNAQQLSPQSISDNFSTDSGLWTYLGSAYRDPTNDYLALTNSGNDQAGVAFFNYAVSGSFTVNFSYLVGEGNSGDGFTMFFYKQPYSTFSNGGDLGFNTQDAIIPGYGIEFDGWQNIPGDFQDIAGGVMNPPTGDPSGAYIALIQNSVGDHLAYTANDPRVDNNQWHNVSVVVGDSSVSVYVDQGLVLQWTGALNTTYAGFGFSGADGEVGSNYHIIANFSITANNLGTPEPIPIGTPTPTANPEQSPVISSVSPISPTLVQTITLQGSDFGNIQPQLLSLGDGSVDTVWCGSTPSIVILDERNLLSAGAAGAWSGFTNGPPDLIGVVLVSWTNTEIVLGGFGSGLGSQFSWSQVLQGDVLQIQIQTVSGVATYNTVAVSNQSNQNLTSGSTGAPPVISSVSPISATRLQTITIKGSGFENTQPQTISLGDGSVDTIDGGNTPSIQIRDNHLIAGWTAGYGENGIGIILVSWSNNEIVLGGFGTLLTTNSQGSYNLLPGDPIQILVKSSGTVTSYNTVVLGSPENTNDPNNASVITSVSPISTDVSQTIVIKGSGFGNIQPQTMSLGDGSIDTVGGGITPVIQIHDDGWCGWEAGTQDGPTTGADSIGIIIVSWSDTEIVLGGFGSALYTNGQWSISPGDPMRIVVLTSGGVSVYDTTVTGGSGTASNSRTTSPPTLSTSQLVVSCQSSTTTSNFRVEINGNLTVGGIGIPGALIYLYYSINEGSSWQGLTTVNTDSDGNFLADWLPSVTGNYLINATYAGDSTYPGASTVVTLVVTPYPSENAQDVFSVASNSTVSDLAFNSTSGQLSFTVSGPSGTTGYSDVYIAKSLVNDISTVKSYIDGNTLNYTVTSTADSWILHFTYHHSTHEITINLNNASTSTLSITQLLQGVTYGAIISLSVIVALLLILRKRQD